MHPKKKAQIITTFHEINLCFDKMLINTKRKYIRILRSNVQLTTYKARDVPT
jgi:hypothetical protein